MTVPKDCAVCDGRGEVRGYEYGAHFCMECQGTGEQLTEPEAAMLRLVRRMLETMHRWSMR